MLEARNEDEKEFIKWELPTLAAWKMRGQAQPVAGPTGWPVDVVIPVRRESGEEKH